MTVTQRKAQPVQDDAPTAHEPGEQYQCDACACDLTHTVRIKCADPVCTSTEEGVDICPPCFCAGKEFGNHKRGHAYRVIEFHSYPIFTEDWGADEELLLIKGIASQGLGNWKKISEHVGTRTKEEVEQHYSSVYVDSPTWPLPDMNREFSISPAEFQSRKRKRIAEMHMAPPPPLKPAPVSVPGIHEIATYLPGRLEFEHEIDNEAEDVVKDLEFGVCLDFGGDEIPIDDNDLDVKARAKWEEEKKNGRLPPPPQSQPPAAKTAPPPVNGISNTTQDVKMENADDENAIEEATGPPPIETPDSMAFKFTLIDMYRDRVAKREEAKAIMFDRGLLEYKKMQAADKKRPKEERETLHRIRPFARLQSSEDYENFAADILYEGLLRKRIQDLQQYRRLGLVTPADIERYDLDLARRTQAKTASYVSDKYRNSVGRLSTGPTDENKATPDSAGGPTTASSSGPSAPRRPGPLNLSNSPSLHLLTPGEQLLCSQLRILPKPYLVIKETLVREYARRGGKLRRREARDLVKVDANKTSRVWDFLVQTGFLKINDPVVAPNPVLPAGPGQGQTQQQESGAGSSNSPSVNGSPIKSLPSLNGNGASVER